MFFPFIRILIITNLHKIAAATILRVIALLWANILLLLTRVARTFALSNELQPGQMRKPYNPGKTRTCCERMKRDHRKHYPTKFNFHFLSSGIEFYARQTSTFPSLMKRPFLRSTCDMKAHCLSATEVKPCNNLAASTIQISRPGILLFSLTTEIVTHWKLHNLCLSIY